MSGQHSRRVQFGVAGIITDADGRVLLTKRSRAPRAGYWHLPGGAVEFGESTHAALERELREELGVVTEVIGRLPADVTQSIIPAEDRHVVMHFHRAVIVSGVPRPKDGTLEIGWFDEKGAAALDPLLDSCGDVLRRMFGWRLPMP